MNIPKSFKVPMSFRERYLRWIEDAGMLDKSVFDWITGVVTFENDEDATAFYLATGIERYKTKVEKMIENERLG